MANHISQNSAVNASAGIVERAVRCVADPLRNLLNRVAKAFSSVSEGLARDDFKGTGTSSTTHVPNQDLHRAKQNMLRNASDAVNLTKTPEQLNSETTALIDNTDKTRDAIHHMNTPRSTPARSQRSTGPKQRVSPEETVKQARKDANVRKARMETSHNATRALHQEVYSSGEQLAAINRGLAHEVMLKFKEEAGE